ncbi:MAG TPA: hypothetical protein VES03_05735, partial [Motilibacterales bacterium]|nr:hypothetical protein [Motilibacterales bacterium]
ETSVAGVPITVYAPTSAPADAYRQLAREVVARIDPDSVGAVEPGAGEPGGDAPGAEQLALG